VGVALKVVSLVERKLELLFEPERSGESVSEVCRRNGISRESFYLYRRRYLAEGEVGLEERSRKPRTSPGRIDAGLERLICELRTRHPRWGARRIRTELARSGTEPPAVSTVHKALKRNYLVAPQPPRRPRADKRFEREVSNDLWQIDATRVLLADETPVWVIDLLDDHARYLLGATAFPDATSEAAWEAFTLASAMHGLPRQLLSDNGLCFTGRLHGNEVLFERLLAKTGVQLINSAPYHPETLGKLERFHRTLKEWLAEERPAVDLRDLQALLDRFRDYYNVERPHQGIDDLTPAERYQLGFELVHGTRPAAPAAAVDNRTEPPSYPAYSILRKVSRVGLISYQTLQIQLGSRWNGATVRVVPLGELIQIYHADELIRALVPDRTKRHQTLGRRKTPTRTHTTAQHPTATH
jgi:transposase InsO family protein